MDDKTNRVDDNLKQMEQLRVSESEDYNLLKLKLESEVQLLEQQLSQMRVTYQLNQEKLEYNYQVLKKREEENGSIIGAQKRKINRLAEQLNILKVKSVKQDKSLSQENSALNNDFDNLNQQYKQLFKKFRLFQQADANRFKEVWEMNEEQVKMIMHQILMADKIIHTQQLGMEWEMPVLEGFGDLNPLTFHESSSSIREGEEDEVKFDAGSSLALKYSQSKSQSEIVGHFFELLSEETSFLVLPI